MYIRNNDGETDFLTKTEACFDRLQGEPRFNVFYIHQVHAFNKNLSPRPKPAPWLLSLVTENEDYRCLLKDVSHAETEYSPEFSLS